MIKISNRIKIIFSNIAKCQKFADVGCDHGYTSKLMLDNDRCKELIFSDISAPSLKKAEELLKDYPNARAVCCSGLTKIDTDCDCVLISGMGGENIIQILQEGFFPERLVLQPMKNVDKLRVFLMQNSYILEKDFIFKAEDKFYNLLIASKGTEVLTEQEITYGKDNLQNPSTDFLEYLQIQIAKNQTILNGLVGEQKELMLNKVSEEKALYERLRVKGQVK